MSLREFTGVFKANSISHALQAELFGIQCGQWTSAFQHNVNADIHPTSLEGIQLLSHGEIPCTPFNYRITYIFNRQQPQHTVIVMCSSYTPTTFNFLKIEVSMNRHYHFFLLPPHPCHRKACTLHTHLA